MPTNAKSKLPLTVIVSFVSIVNIPGGFSTVSAIVEVVEDHFVESGANQSELGIDNFDIVAQVDAPVEHLTGSAN